MVARDVKKIGVRRNNVAKRGAKHDGCCPMLALLQVLAGPWTLYLLWILRNQGQLRFGELKRAAEGISSRVLTERLRLLEREGLVFRKYGATVPPHVTYGLTTRTFELHAVLDQLNKIASKWYEEDGKPIKKCVGAE